jgi:hypothetical protein
VLAGSEGWGMPGDDIGRWELPPVDMRVRLAKVLERWAPGGIECRSLDEMNYLLECLALEGVQVKARTKGAALFVETAGDHALTRRPGQEWEWTCSCEAWSLGRAIEQEQALVIWRGHIKDVAA